MVSKYLLCRIRKRGKQVKTRVSKPISIPNKTSFVSHSRMAGEERREQILSVAMTLFSNHGFRGTTTKEIAHAAGVSEAMVFRHFATKEELYAAILDHKACAHDRFNPKDLAADAIKRKDDRAVFESLALAALD